MPPPSPPPAASATRPRLRAALRLREATKEPRPLFFARLNVVETLSKLGALAEADAMLPPSRAAERRRSWKPSADSSAAHLLRQGHDAAALVQADRSRTLAAATPERKMRVAAAVPAAAYRGDHRTAAPRCERPATSRPVDHTAELEIALASAQAASPGATPSPAGRT